MYKLLVVDDEFHIRDGIIHFISWEDYGISIAGEARDGLEAFGLVEMLQPDIVLTDIEMDPMNGLELAEMIRRDYPQTKVVILTGYDDFEYARKAINLKVCSFVLKPVLPDELVQVITNIVSELEEERRLREQITKNDEQWRDKILTELFEDSQSRHQSSERLFKAAHYTCLLFATEMEKMTPVVGAGAGSFPLMSDSLREELMNIYMPDYEITAHIYRNQKMYLIVGSSETLDESLRHDLKEKAERTKRVLRDWTNNEVDFGIGGTYVQVLELGKSMSEAETELNRKLAHTDEWDQSGARYKTVILRAREYIANHYMDPDLSLEAIASHLYLTPSYFSKLYKEETGETYIKFLTELRIQEAKTQLRLSNKKIVTISESIGYRNAQYFCTLFKKVVGMPPAEYRAEQGNSNSDE